MKEETLKNQTKLLTQILNTPPKDEKGKFIFFLPSDRKKWLQVVQECGYFAFLIEELDAIEESDAVFSVQKCIQILAGLLYGSEYKRYVFVICCYKDDNDLFIDFFKTNNVRFEEGWKLFSGLPKDNADDVIQYVKGKLASFTAMSDQNRKDMLQDTILNQFHLFDNQGRPRAPFDYAIEEDIKRKYNIIIIDEVPYVYDNGVYKVDITGTAVKKIIKMYLYPQFIKAKNINAIYTLLVEDRDLQRSNDQINQYPDTWICFMDCMFDVLEWEPHNHSPAYYCVNQIPYKWTDIIGNNKCDKFKDFFNFSVPEKSDQQMFLEYAGLSLTKDAKWQKILILTGPGGTGKSILLRLVSEAIGINNCAAVSLQGLQQRFATALLYGKLVNICADLPNDTIIDASIIKQLIGDDWIFGERKGQQAFWFRSYAKQLYSANSLPLMQGERNNGIFRRLMILEMSNVPEKPDITLYDKIKNERLGIIWLAVDALHQMYIDCKIHESANSQKCVHRLMNDSDTVSAWIDECCEIDKKSRVERSVLYEHYSKYCENEDRQPLSKTRFFAALRSKGISEIKSHGIRIFIGIKMRQIQDEKCPETAPDQYQNCPQNDFLSVDDGQIIIPFPMMGQNGGK